MAHYLGVDIGTTKIATVVVDAPSGKLMAIHSVPNESEITSSADQARGRSEWDADRVVELTSRCIAGAVASAGATAQVEGVAVTGQMHGMLLVGNDGAPVCPFINWQDQRCENKIDSGGTSYIARMMELAGPSGFDRTGCRPATGYMSATLFWMALNGDLRVSAEGGPRQRPTAVFLPDYFVMRLTGCGPVTDPTNAGGSGVFDVIHRQWDWPLIEKLGIARQVLPAVQPSGTIIGRLNREAARATGLREGLPVCVGCGDNQASFAGSVDGVDSALLVNVGTGAQISLWVPRRVSVPGLDTRCHLDEGYLLVGALLCGGSSYALLRELFRQVGAAFFEGSGDEAIYEEMTRLAAAVPSGADGLRCEPLFCGTRAEPQQRAAFTGLSPANFTPGHFGRAVLEGVAEQLRFSYSAMISAGISPRNRLVGSGNAIRKNRLLATILENAFALPLALPRHEEEAACGAALQAARACLGRRES